MQRRCHRVGVGTLQHDGADLEFAGRPAIDFLQHLVDFSHHFLGGANQKNTRGIIRNNQRRRPASLVRADHYPVQDIRGLLRLSRGKLDHPKRIAVLAEFAIELLEQRVNLRQLLGGCGHQQCVRPLIRGELRLNRAGSEFAAHAEEPRTKNVPQRGRQLAGLGVLKRIQLQSRLHAERRLVQKLDDLINECNRLRRAHDDQGIGLRIAGHPHAIGVKHRLDGLFLKQQLDLEISRPLRLPAAGGHPRVEHPANTDGCTIRSDLL